MAANGIPIATVQLLGRWSSKAVEKYTQAAPLALAPVAPAVALGNLRTPGLAGDPGGLGLMMQAGPSPPEVGGGDQEPGPGEMAPAGPAIMDGEVDPPLMAGGPKVSRSLIRARSSRQKLHAMWWHSWLRPSCCTPGPGSCTARPPRSLTPTGDGGRLPAGGNMARPNSTGWRRSRREPTSAGGASPARLNRKPSRSALARAPGRRPRHPSPTLSKKAHRPMTVLS